MAIQAKKQSPWLVILIIAAAVVLWALEQRPEPSADTAETRRPPETSTPPKPAPRPEAPDRRGQYQIYRNCKLAADKNNDGDSFRVRLSDGREEIFRLYFVDTPESAFKSYRNGENNHDRIRDQADYFNIAPQRAVEIGQAGKHLTLGLLAEHPFTLYTKWDSPFRDQRYHAFIEVTENGRPRWLHELLVAKGLARLKTKPADLPDGTAAAAHRKQLEARERSAKATQAGAWQN